MRRIERIWMALSVGLSVCVARPALAADAEHGGDQVSLFSGDLGNAVWTLLIFLLVILVLGKFAWGPILRVLNNREKFIRDSLTEAKREREEAKQTLADYTRKLDEAREEATAIVGEGRRDAEEVRKKILAEAKADSVAVTKRARREIEIARDDAVKQLHDQTVLLATSIAGKLVRKELNAGDHRELVDEALTEMGGMN
jgi:F-type H+-transporting ATPase subunit b